MTYAAPIGPSVAAAVGGYVCEARSRVILPRFGRHGFTRIGARLERAALVPPDEGSLVPPTAITLAIDAGHMKSIRTYQMRSFEVMLARVRNDQGQEVVFSSLPAETDRQVRQLQHVLRRLGATATTPVTILSDGAEGPRALGAAASVGPIRNGLDWLHLSMRVQHVAQAVKGCSTAAPAAVEQTTMLDDAVTRLRWRLWHGPARTGGDPGGQPPGRTRR